MLSIMDSINDKRESLANHFLIAMPSLMDENFSQTVTYICEHTDEGALGITINRPTDIVLGEVLEQSHITAATEEIAQHPIFLGGPVQTERGFILHRRTPKTYDGSLDVTDEIQLTSSRDILEDIAHNEGPDDYLISLGYAGWGGGQLEREMAENAWLSCPADSAIIFDTPVEKRWESAASLLGIDLQLLSNDAGHA